MTIPAFVGSNSPKTGRGRFRKTPSVADVETVACPERDGPHWLINRGEVTVCRGCGRSWAALDAEIRGGAA